MKISELNKYDDDAELLVVVGDRVEFTSEASASEDGKFVLLLGETVPKPRKHYTYDDIRFIMRAMSRGFSDEVIAKAIGKTPDSLRRKIKDLEIGRNF
ncbi:MAG: hypothetical protein ACO3N7_04430 [Kiritimatiellia bacterium]